jgi:HAE1 family hydrophobic/amphiphilic exporter-1
MWLAAWIACGTSAPAPTIDRSVPTVTATIVAPGAPPELVERTITAPADAVLGSLSGVDEIASSSADSLATLTVRFTPGTAPADARRAVEERLRSSVLGLPAGTEIDVHVAAAAP